MAAQFANSVNQHIMMSCRKTTSGGGGGAKKAAGASAAGMWRFYTEDSPGIKVYVSQTCVSKRFVKAISVSGKVVTFQESILLVNASFRRRHVSFVGLLLATAPIAWAG